ncbi:RNA polymerase II-associated [Microdochium bolleyi]|uniref:RNA polymerase II-associated n=1 Tax=Microdochium bolleyi TaxID=196109 RepID=A0A136JBI6_9PEZI|nr:RNA polymerase II-associated [Microdochium bolleyi]
MASSSRGAGEHRPVQQDFIARIRYSNALPPPPNPPKLLDIPSTGLSSGQYTTPGFASRLAREQPLNIEADAELGMPLDLVGMPGVFDGDESSIQAPLQAQPIHPHDRHLLRPLATLGKPNVSEPSVSFLRRTEYISSIVSKARPDASLRGLNSNPLQRQAKRASPEPDKDSPAYVKRKIDQSFVAAAANLKDKSRIRHPTKRNLKLVEAYPLIPDRDAFPDSGAYVTIKFSNNPVPASTTYDTRLLSSILRPIEKSEAEEAAYQAAAEAHEQDPENNPKPPTSMNYDFFLSDSSIGADKFRKMFDVDNPDRYEESLYTHTSDSGPYFQFSRLRAYETSKETDLDHERKYDEEVILSYEDGSGRGQKAVYYYPVMQRSTIKPQRTKNIHRTIPGVAQEDEQIIERLDVTVTDPDEETKADMERFKENPYSYEEEDAEDAADRHQNGRQHSSPEHRRNGGASDDEDADGDEDEI